MGTSRNYINDMMAEIEAIYPNVHRISIPVLVAI
jgi:hypothetical protein